MALQSLVQLATITLQSSSAEIKFTGMPTVYRDLVLFGALRTDRADTNDPIRLRFNSDSTSGNYTRIAMYGNSGGAGGYSDSPGEVIIDAGASAASSTAGIFSALKLDLIDYRATDKYKTILTSSDLSTIETRRQAARWASLTAIDTITITPYFGTNFVAGSNISIYGRIA